MKFDKETLIALIVCVVILIAWPFVARLFNKSDAKSGSVETVRQEAPAAVPTETAVESAKAPAAAATPVKTIRLANADLALEINPDSAAIVKVTYLNHYYANGKSKVETVYGDRGEFQLLANNWSLNGEPVVKTDGLSCTITRAINAPQGVLKIVQTFSLKEKGCEVNCSYLVSVPGAKNEVVLTDLVVYGPEIAPWHTVSGDKKRAVSHRMDYRTNYGENDDISSSEDDEDFYFARPPAVLWAAVSNKYFCSVFKQLDNRHGFQIWQDRRFITKDEPIIAVGAVLPPVKIAPGKEAKFDFAVYDGPKNIDALGDFAEGGAGVMHLAWGPLNYLARLLLWILGLFHSLCNSWGVSIILLTILVRAVFYPITAKGNESMKKMQRVQPMFKELREKYKDNPQLLNQKMTELYRAEGINPFAGCLPILLQIPIFFALYAMLDNAIDLRHVSFLWCKNLAAADTIFTIPLFIKNWSIPVNPLVLAMTALMVIQQRMTPMSMDPAQKKMMALMPVVMLFFLYDLPSGLTLYWTISNLFSILQLWLQKRRGQQTGSAKPQNQGN
ncbi:MAG: membrane protein insertase YidC [Lentisphaerae bacterium]|nr:membrane protein insertase YidC [Lentisphaerota bacterium]